MKSYITLCKLLDKTAKASYKFIIADDPGSVFNRLRLHMIMSNIKAISDYVVVEPLRSIKLSTKVIKLNLLGVLSSIKLICSLGYFRSVAEQYQFKDLPEEALGIAAKIEEYLFKIVQNTPELIVRQLAVNYLSDRDKLIYLASGKDFTNEVRLNAIKQIAINVSDDQKFLKAIVDDPREEYGLRTEALRKITDKAILRSILGDTKNYDVLFLGVVLERLRKLGS